MKSFIIHTPSIPKTKMLAFECAESFRKHTGWGDIKLHAGCDPYTLPTFQEKYKLSDERSKFKRGHGRYKSKKACFYSHYDLWNMCVELNESIAIMEYDTTCVGDYPNIEFTGVLHLAVESILRDGIYSSLWPQDYKRIRELSTGIHSVNGSQKFNNHSCIPGNVAYVITPEAAKILIDDCIENGWQQNDILMTDEFFPIVCYLPSPVMYDKNKELHTSSNQV